MDMERHRSGSEAKSKSHQRSGKLGMRLDQALPARFWMDGSTEVVEGLPKLDSWGGEREREIEAGLEFQLIEGKRRPRRKQARWCQHSYQHEIKFCSDII